MKMELHVLVVSLLSALLLLPWLSLAQYDNSTVMVPDMAAVGLRAERVSESVADMQMQGYPVDEQMLMGYTGRPSPPPIEFHESLSYAGPTDWLPMSAICLTYSDNYRKVVHDFWIDRRPLLAGKSNCLPVELIRCYYADYYHIIGTSLFASVQRQPQNFINTPSLICRPGQCGLY